MKQLLVSIFMLLSQMLMAQIQHFEPLHWWVGMKNPSVQLLVHSPNISAYTPSVKHKGVRIEKVHTTENPNYLFIDVLIEKDAAAGQMEFEFSHPKNKKIIHTWELKNRKPNSANRESFTTEDVIYLITPDRFANGDESNDNTENTIEKINRSHFNGRHGGDLQGIFQHLDYIKKMGFTTIWCMPLLENNLKQVTYHGYSITDYYKIDPRFGSNELWVEMVEKSKEMGLKWIMDVIPNHCGIDHWWMKDLPSKDWINNEGKFTPNSHRREVHQDPYVSEKDKYNMVNGWFVPSMPDLNHNNPFLARYVTQNTIWWIEYASLAGLRVDTYPYSEKSFLTHWTKAILDEYPNLNMVGEEWTSRPQTIAYWQKGAKNADGYQSYIPSMMDFPMQMALAPSLTDKEDFHTGFARLYTTLTDDYLYPDPFNLVVFGDNHDMSRFFTQVKEDVALFKMGLAYLATIRGIPQIYYGTEIAMGNPDSEDHGVIRADMPGGWKGDQKNAFTGENLSDLERDVQQFTQKLFNWRKSASLVHHGKLKHFVPQNGVYTYFRYSDTEKLGVFLNKSEQEVNLSLSDYAELKIEAMKGMDVLDGSTWSNQITVPAKGFRIVHFK